MTSYQKLELVDLQKLYDPNIYPLELEYSDYKKDIYVEDGIYKFNNLHLAIIEEFYHNLIINKTIIDGYLTIKCILTGEILVSNYSKVYHKNILCFHFSKNNMIVFFYDKLILVYYKEINKLYYSNPHLFSRDKLVGKKMCHRLFNLHKNGTWEKINNCLNQLNLNSLDPEKENKFTKDKFDIYIKFSLSFGHCIWNFFVELEYLISSNLIQYVNKVFILFKGKDYLNYGSFFKKILGDKLVIGKPVNRLIINKYHNLKPYISDSTRKLFNRLFDEHIYPSIGDRCNEEIDRLMLKNDDFKILLNIKKNRRVIINGDEFYVKMINSIQEKFPNTLFYFTGVYGINSGREFDLLEKSFQYIKENLIYPEKLINLNGYDIKILYFIGKFMNFLIGQTGSGPREMIEWYYDTPSFILDKHYGHAASPFICYDKFTEVYGLSTNNRNVIIREINITVAIDNFKLTDDDMVKRIDGINKYISEIIPNLKKLKINIYSIHKNT